MEWIILAGIIYFIYSSVKGSDQDSSAPQPSDKMQSTFIRSPKPEAQPELERQAKETARKYSNPKQTGSGSSNRSPSQHHRPVKLNQGKQFIENITLSDEQRRAFELIENSSDHYFITGKAGTGKSVLLQYLKHKSKKKDTLVVGAFTGIAALNVGGQTLHSLFRLPFGLLEPEKISLYRRTKELIERIETLVIDEVSMVRVDILEAIDTLFRRAKGSRKPFGGAQLLLFGDVYQLPPVVTDNEIRKYILQTYGGVYFFNAPVWSQINLKTIELSHVFRQNNDQRFLKILNAIRTDDFDTPLLDDLNSRYTKNPPAENVITLAPRTRTVDQINSERLDSINEPAVDYKAKIAGKIEKSSYPTDELLTIKVGAQIMLLRNDPEKRWVNGTIGAVESLTNDEVKISIDGLAAYSIERVTWEKIEYYYNAESKTIEQEVVGTFTQFPMKLAWAFTIHKSQGKTYNSVVVNMEGGAFTHGQTYVALSRCASLEGLYLTTPLDASDIIVDPRVNDFMKKTLQEHF